MIYVKDILRIDGSFLSFDQIQRQMNFLSDSFMLYYSVLSALPSSWKRILKQGNFEIESSSLNCDNTLLNEFRKPKKISKLTYNIFLNKFSSNTSETNQQDKWQRDLQNNLNDSLIWKKIHHNKLIESLQKINQDGKNIRLISKLYWEQTAAIKINNDITGYTKIKRGVRQGCVMSPSLFNLCTELVFREISDMK